jgi:DNA-binding IclR family transcriptional regulator
MALDTKNNRAKPRPPSPGQKIQVIARAANVLRALEGEEGGLSLGQIAQRVGLARSTVQRIVESLSAEQFLIAATPSSGVRLGPAFIRIASSMTLEINQITRPIMMQLCQSVGETVDLSVLKGRDAVFVDQISGSHRLRAVSAIGEAFPLHCTANGKALLSLLTDEKVERLLQAPLAAFTRNTPTKAGAIIAEVQSCRRRGFALDDEEYTEGICAVGTAFLDPLSRPMALSIPVPATRFKRRRAELTEKLLEARAQITAAVGSKDADR